MNISGSHSFQVGSNNNQTNIELDLSTLPPPQSLTAEGAVPHNLPPASAVFEGRHLSDLVELLGDTHAGVMAGQAAVYGLGGIGKSELANQYARAHLDRYKLVWWITAETRQTVGLGLAELTKRLHPMPRLTDAEHWAKAWLQDNPGWLLILDNVENVNDVADLLGLISGRGHVLMTTRRSLGSARWRRLGLKPLRLDVLDRAASVRLLLDLADLDDAADASDLAAALGDLPLGLQQAAAYISLHEGMTFADYTALLAEEFDRAAGDGGDDDLRTMAAVWSVTMSSIEATNTLAAEVLEILGWLGADPLPESVLRREGQDKRVLDDALALLASYSMVTRRPGTVTVHRLVQAVTRSKTVLANHGDLCRELAIGLVSVAVPADPSRNVAGWLMWATLIPHVQAIVDRLPGDHRSKVAVRLQDRAATYLQYQGKVGPAIVLFERALADAERILGSDDRDTVTARANLANAYGNADRMTDSVTLYERVVAENELLLGRQHRATIAARGNLAAAYMRTDRAADAVALLELVVSDGEQNFGADDEDTLMTRGNLAVVYADTGRLAEAVAMQEKAVADYERVLGPEHPVTLLGTSNLATLLGDMGLHGDSIAILERCATDAERVLGGSHPDTKTVLANLAVAYASVGRIRAAIAMNERLLADDEGSAGNENSRTLTFRSNLAVSYLQDGRIEDAVAAAELVLAEQKRIFGEDDGTTVMTAKFLQFARSRRRTGESGLTTVVRVPECAG